MCSCDYHYTKKRCWVPGKSAENSDKDNKGSGGYIVWARNVQPIKEKVWRVCQITILMRRMRQVGGHQKGVMWHIKWFWSSVAERKAFLETLESGASDCLDSQMPRQAGDGDAWLPPVSLEQWSVTRPADKAQQFWWKTVSTPAQSTDEKSWMRRTPRGTADSAELGEATHEEVLPPLKKHQLGWFKQAEGVGWFSETIILFFQCDIFSFLPCSFASFQCFVPVPWFMHVPGTHVWTWTFLGRSALCFIVLQNHWS